MSLFKTDSLIKKTTVLQGFAKRTKGKTRFLHLKAQETLDERIGTLIPPENIQMVSYGEWSTHDLLLFILNQTGPAKVYFTTWAISEFSIRQLYQLCQDGLITELRGLFDYRNGIHKPGALQLLRSLSDNICPAKCHAKVLLVFNDTWGVSILSSANMTENPRWEAGTICTDRDMCFPHMDWIDSVIQNELEKNGSKEIFT